MNFYEAEMRKMFGGNELLTDMKFVGKTMLGKLDDEKLVKFQFVSTGTADKYTAIQASVIDKNDGVLDKQTMKFSEIIGMYNRGNGLDAIEPHMWEYHGKPEWYTPISNPQKAEIAERVLDYVGMFQDHTYALEMQFH